MSERENQSARETGGQRARVDTIDYAKGVGILLVVAAHVWRGLDNARVRLPQPAFDAMDRWVYGFHMPLFFVASGLFLYRSAAKPAGSFLREKAATLLWPYLLWATIYWQLGGLAARGARASTGDFVPSLLTIPPGSHLWFLWVLLACSLVVLALRKLRLPAWAAFAVSVGIYLLASRYALHVKAAALLHVAVDRPLFLFAMFLPYVAGAAALAGPLLWACGRLPIALWIAISVVGAAVVTHATRGGPADAQMFDLVSGVAGTLMVLGIARVLEHDRAWPIRLLGRYSLEIYLVHILAAAAMRLALQRFADVSAWWVHLPLGLAAGLLVPLALAVASRRVGVPLLFRLPLPRAGRDAR